MSNQSYPDTSLDLRIQKISSSQLMRNDLIFHLNDVWRCQSVNMLIFQNLQSKKQQKIPLPSQQQQKSSNPHEYLRVQKLQLIPLQWKITPKQQNQILVKLKGQQLGLGPVHQIQVIGMRQFQQLEVVKSEKIKGKNIPYKVILCKTKKDKCYLIVGIDFIN